MKRMFAIPAIALSFAMTTASAETVEPTKPYDLRLAAVTTQVTLAPAVRGTELRMATEDQVEALLSVQKAKHDVVSRELADKINRMFAEKMSHVVYF